MGSRREFLTRPLLPCAETTIYEEFSTKDIDFHEDAPHGVYQPISTSFDFHTALVSSTSSSSLVDSTESMRNHTETSPYSNHSQRAFASDSSTSYEYQYVNDALEHIEPSITVGPNFNLDDYLPDYMIEVEFIGLRDVYEKTQSRKDKKARQRIMHGDVTIAVKTDGLIDMLNVWVRREQEAAARFKDKNGEIDLNAKRCKYVDGRWLYSVNLDSEYDGRERPVYELAKVEMKERNRFELVAQVVFKNGQQSDKFTSKSFLVRTHKRLYPDEGLQQSTSQVGNKRPHTWHNSAVMRKKPAWSPLGTNSDNEADSSASPLGSSGSSTPNQDLNKMIVDHLEAQIGHINRLTIGSIQTKRGDLAYHIQLTEQAKKQNLTEGVVVGFFHSDGRIEIELLSSQNVDKAVMAGVVSRSAWLEAETPDKIDRGSTDAVCVIGMICVKVKGSILPGERIYTSSENDGVAVPESHLPIGSFVTGETTMLGMAMEPLTAKKPGDLNLVKCFVCIVLGISSKQVTREVQNVMNSMEANLKSEVKKSSKRTWRRIYCLSALAFLFLAAVGFFCYEYFATGTFYWYWRCSRGAMPGHFIKYRFRWDGKEVEVHALEFDLNSLQKKLYEFEQMKICKFPNTKEGDEVRYYLNIDRCAYGGPTDGGLWGSGKTVKGSLVLATGCPCALNKPIFKFIDVQPDSTNQSWCAYVQKAPIKGTLVCEPSTCTAQQRNFSFPTRGSLKPEQKCRKVNDDS